MNLPRIFRYPLHWFYLLLAAARLLVTFARAIRYFDAKAIRALQLPHAESLTPAEQRRLRHYFYGTTFLSAVFGALRGRGRSAKEKRIYTNLAALAYFFDDLVDNFSAEKTGLQSTQNSPEHFSQTADQRGLSLHFLANIYRELPSGDVEEFKKYMHRVFKVEVEGRQKSDSVRLGAGELQKITAEKGGFSVLLFRRMLSHPLAAEEREALFEFGHLVQLCDDIFDLWFDRREKIATLPLFFAEQNRLADMIQHFENQVLATKSALRRTAFPRHRIETAVGLVHFIVSVTRVCLRRYEAVQKRHGRLPLDERHEMVTDMEKWRNRMRLGLMLFQKM